MSAIDGKPIDTLVNGVYVRTADLWQDVQWVTPKDFGALGDGTTDDTLAIQKAIDAVFAAGGGVVRITPSTGSYRVLLTRISYKPRNFMVVVARLHVREGRG